MDASECDVVLETERPHYELFAPPKEPVSVHDYAMALLRRMRGLLAGGVLRRR